MVREVQRGRRRLWEKNVLRYFFDERLKDGWDKIKDINKKIKQQDHQEKTDSAKRLEEGFMNKGGKWVVRNIMKMY